VTPSTPSLPGAPRPARAARAGALALIGLGALTTVALAAPSAPASTASRSYIVQAASTTAAERAVTAAGGRMQSVLGIIDAVSAELTPQQAAELAHRPGVTLNDNRRLDASDLRPSIPTPELRPAGIGSGGGTIAAPETGLRTHGYTWSH
jgi:ABC-type phosphate transport system substrate-binding protein